MRRLDSIRVGLHRFDPAETASGVSPDFLGNFDHEAKLGPLFVFGKQIAFLGAGKATLRAETKLIDVDVFGRRLHPALDLVLGFELAGLYVTRPSTTFLPLGTSRNGSKPPARSVSYSMK